ncbi:MAG: hypothetical protein U0R49_00425 [Fimbriimonadales bacterium]
MKTHGCLIAAILFAAPIFAQEGHDDDHVAGTWTPLTEAPGQDRAAKIYSRLFDKLEYRKDFLFHDGLYWECIGILQAQLGIFPRDGELNSTLVWMYGNVERQDMAYTEAVRFHSLFPNELTGALTEAEWCSKRKLWTRIPPILERVIANSNILGEFVLLARAYEEMGLLNEALRILELRKQKVADRAVDVKIASLKKRLAGGE